MGSESMYLLSIWDPKMSLSKAPGWCEGGCLAVGGMYTPLVPNYCSINELGHLFIYFKNMC